MWDAGLEGLLSRRRFCQAAGWPRPARGRTARLSRGTRRRRERPAEAGRLRARVDLRARDCGVPDGAGATRPLLPVPGSLRELGIAPFRVTSIWPGNLKFGRFAAALKHECHRSPLMMRQPCQCGRGPGVHLSLAVKVLLSLARALQTSRARGNRNGRRSPAAGARPGPGLGT